MSQESRRNSMFFGSHEGARRGAILYSIAISCKLNGINLFEYISDVIEKTIEWQPNTPLEKYRDLLPDRWKKQQQHLFNLLLLLFLNYARYKRGAAYRSIIKKRQTSYKTSKTAYKTSEISNEMHQLCPRTWLLVPTYMCLFVNMVDS